MDHYIYSVVMQFIGVIVFAWLLFRVCRTKKCGSKSIHSHDTFIIGSMHRKCKDCGAEFYGDYFSAREGGGNVLNYYIMIERVE